MADDEVNRKLKREDTERREQRGTDDATEADRRGEMEAKIIDDEKKRLAEEHRERDRQARTAIPSPPEPIDAHWLLQEFEAGIDPVIVDICFPTLGQLDKLLPAPTPTNARKPKFKRHNLM